MATKNGSISFGDKDDSDIDIESDEDNDSDSPSSTQRHSNNQNYTQAEKRAHHNALERKRRDHIKESFTSLRESVPSLKGEKASRAQILKKTTECIQVMRTKISDNRKNVDELKKQNALLEAQIHVLENSKNGFATDSAEYQIMPGEHSSLQDSSDGDGEPDFTRRSKKMKTSYLG